jgi:predicted metal-dependent HD superfamily phosphohydrolase
MQLNIERWTNLMNNWGFGPNQQTFDALVKAYGERHRHYHTAEHIDACLLNLDRSALQIEHPHEVELALWFHDAVYNPLSKNNELESANWAESFLSENRATSDAIQRVQALIMATVHDAPALTKDASLLIDIDLAILGVQPQAYETFEKAVRKEYRFVPAFIYRKKRAEILKQFLSRERIYQNEPFASQLEAQARINLTQAIDKLESRA